MMYPNPQVPPVRPPRRSHGPRNAVIAAIGAFVLMIGGCSAVVALAGNGDEPAAKPVAAAPVTSSPTPAAKLKVPDLVGMNGQDASDRLDELGFTKVHTGSEDGSVPIMLTNWTVKAQSVPAGKKVRPSRSITLTLTRPENASDDDPAPSVEPGDDPGTTSAPDIPDDDPAVTPDDQPAHTGGTATFTVTGTAPDGVDITYGDESSNLSGDGLPFTETMKVKDDAMYYAVTAQLQGGGHIHCSVTIGGKTKSGEAKGDYNICSAQLNSGVFGGWD